ncbi:hypothetical protein [Reinekea sp. G2M2-21]|uniref:hypothetical protein n=1 Tax=Reinekea sp. G2M2-21 TaxID=2788942 RepID=UPI0018A959C3|nr:hypothetical protein [Reinekea sp. G2M2-21]
MSKDGLYYDTDLRFLTDSEVSDHLALWRFKGSTPWLTTVFADGEFPFALWRENSSVSGTSRIVIVANTVAENRWDGKAWQGICLDSALHYHYSPDLSRTQALAAAEGIINAYWDKRVIHQIEPKTRTTLTLDDLNNKWAYFIHCITEEYFGGE